MWPFRTVDANECWFEETRESTNLQIEIVTFFLRFYFRSELEFHNEQADPQQTTTLDPQPFQNATKDPADHPSLRCELPQATAIDVSN